VTYALVGALFYILPSPLPESILIDASGNFNSLNLAMFSLAISLVHGLVSGAIMGILLVWLLRSVGQDLIDSNIATVI
jgi:hypothetical protein